MNGSGTAQALVGGFFGVAMAVVVVAGIFQLNKGGSTGVVANSGAVANNAISGLFSQHGLNFTQAVA